MKLKIVICLSLLFCQQTILAAILADYVFEDNLIGNIAGAPDIEYLGNAQNYETGTAQGLPVKALTIELATGLKLDLSNWNICDEFSVVLHGYLDDVDGYRKLIDFRDKTSDSGLYNRDGIVNFVIGFSAVNESLIADEYFQMVLTRDATDLVSVYVNGDLQLSFTDTALSSSMCFSSQLHFFIDDNATSIENPSGAISRVTIYDHVLTEDEVGELEILDIIFATDFEIIELP